MALFFTFIPKNSHMFWNHLYFFSFSATQWCFSTYRNVLNYDRSCFYVRPYSNTSSTIIYDATFFSPRYLYNVSHSVCILITIAKNVGSAFRSLIGITFHRRFPSGVKNSIIPCASSSSTTCQYPLSMSTSIKCFASVLMSCTESSNLGMGTRYG